MKILNMVVFLGVRAILDIRGWNCIGASICEDGYGRPPGPPPNPPPNPPPMPLLPTVVTVLLSEVGTSANDPGREMTQQREVLFKRFMLLLSSTYVKPQTVAWYAEKLFVTPKHLSTTCKAVSGKTAFNWINEYVMADVRRMLKNSDKSIKEVADGLGFPNISFFGKYVKSHTGLNPTDYRRQLREKKKS